MLQDLDPKLIDAIEELRREFDDKLKRQKQEIQQLLGAQPEVEEAIATPELAAPPPADLDPLGELKLAAADVDRAESQADILDALVRGAARFAPRTALFLNREGALVGWGGSGFGDRDGTIKDLSLTHEPGSAWERVTANVGGIGLDAAECGTLTRQLDAEEADMGVVIPFVLGDQVGAVLYADRGPSEGTVEITGLQLLSFLASQTLETLPVRSRASTSSLQLATAAPAPAVEELEPEAAAAPEATGVMEAAEVVEPEVPPVEPPTPPPFAEEVLEPEVATVVEAEAVEPESAEVVDAEAVEPEPAEAVEAEAVEPEPAEAVEAEAVELEPAEAVEPEAVEPEPMEAETAEPMPVADWAEAAPAAEAPELDAAAMESPVADLPDTHAEPPHLAEPSEGPSFDASLLEPEAAAEREMPVPAESELGAVAPEIEAPSPQTPVDVPPEGEPPGPLSTQVLPPQDVEGPGWAFTTTRIPTAAGTEALHEEARRLARLLVTEIKLYNEELVEEGRQAGDVYSRLREDIDRSRQIFEDRIDPEVRQEKDYFREALVRILAGGDPSILGT